MKKKITLEDLKVKSFTTQIEENAQQTAKGGGHTSEYIRDWLWETETNGNLYLDCWNGCSHENVC